MPGSGMAPEDADAQSVSIIDSIGFSNGDANTFETLTANYVHERLHQITIDHLFKQEVSCAIAFRVIAFLRCWFAANLPSSLIAGPTQLQTYMAEAIPYDTIVFEDNTVP